VIQFADDLIAYYPDDGSPSLTQEAAVDKWLGDLMDGQVDWARALRQNELDKLVTAADDLEGN
jgi:hypothetical protein